MVQRKQEHQLYRLTLITVVCSTAACFDSVGHYFVTDGTDKLWRNLKLLLYRPRLSSSFLSLLLGFPVTHKIRKVKQNCRCDVDVGLSDTSRYLNIYMHANKTKEGDTKDT